jgi:HEAT repeat protein
MIHNHRIFLLLGLLSGFLMTLPQAVIAAKASKTLTTPPDFTQGGEPDETHDWTLGPTGAHGWIFSAKGQSVDARQILVTAVAPGSPAAGVLQKGDVILGVGGQPFSGDARVQFANAITAAETEKGGGVLKLIRWRAGKREAVELMLKVMGTYSDTAPFNCQKSARVFELGCAAIAKKGLAGVSIPNNMNALALLASGKSEYRPMLAEYAKKVSQYSTESMATWHYGYANMFLAEYVIATGDKSVFEGVKRLALESAHGQSAVGTWGHKFALPSGGLNGYGCMNQPGLSLLVSMALAREAGVKDPALDKALAKGAAFLRWYVGKGAVPYGDHAPWPGHEDNGKCSSAAVLFDLIGDREAAEFFGKMSVAAYSERERGHTGDYFNIAWALPGVIRCGPIAAGAYMKEQAWYYDLARSWDGSVPYQGSPNGEEEHGKYTNWDCTGSFLLAYAVGQKSLVLAGKKPFSVPALSRAQTDEVIAAGRDFFPVNGKSGYESRSTEQLMAGLTSWSPAVRKRSATALGSRGANVLPALLKMLSGTDRNGRYGACEAIGKLGPLADAAAPELRAALKDADPWLQSLAAESLAMLGPESRKQSVSDLLLMTVRPNVADPRRTVQRYAAVALFSPLPGSRGVKSILADSLEGVDRKLLYPAIQSLLLNEDSVARGSLSRIYGKLTDNDVVALLPFIIKAVDKIAPSNEMFGDGVRLAGLDLLSRLHIREGMSLCINVMEPNRWGFGKRLPRCLEYLARYGTHARSSLSQLQEIRKGMASNQRGGESEDLTALDNAIAKITASTTTPTLVDAKDFGAGK